MTEKPAGPIPRMRAGDRRELILEAAMAVFGDHGYVGTTTDQVARAAGVSQPYVVRMFGTKEKLFLEVLERALARLMNTFREALVGNPSIALSKRLAVAYVGLVRDRGLLLTLMHAFVLGSESAIGKRARSGFIAVYRFLRSEAGFSAEEAQVFMANGMMINTMLGLRMGDDFKEDPEAHELMSCTFQESLTLVLSHAPKQGDTW